MDAKKIITEAGAGNFHQSLLMIVSKTREVADLNECQFGVSCLSTDEDAKKLYAVAWNDMKLLAVAGDHYPSGYLAPLTAKKFLELFPLVLPEGWELEIVPCKHFEMDDHYCVEAVGCSGPIKKRVAKSKKGKKGKEGC